MTTLYRYRNYLFVVPLLLSPNLFAISQDTSRITVKVNNSPIGQAIRQIEKQSGYTFLYGAPTLNDEELITVSMSQVGLTRALQGVFKGKPINWQLKNKSIVLSKQHISQATASQLTELSDTIPKVNVSGVVLDRSGKPLPASTVLVKGTSLGSSTTAEGKFVLVNIPANAILTISSIGYESRQEKLNGRSLISVSLNEAVTDLKNVEVVSTGYQDVPRERATGSFVQLDNELVNRTVSTNILDRIYNVTSSLKFEPRPGSSGANGSNISIRGFSTINANMKPLIVIDGFPYEEDASQTNIILNNLNPNDVQSITILRDAAAASIWGDRSGNGVIVITTKKGRYNQKAKVQFNANVNISDRPNLGYLPIISSKDAIDFERSRFATGVFNEYDDLYPSLDYFPVVSPAVEIMLAERRGELTKAEADSQLDALAKHDVRDDINRHLLRTSVNQQYNVNVSGGSNNYNYYASVGYDKNLANEKGNEYTRFTIRLENTFKPLKNLEINGYVVYTQSEAKNSNVAFQNFLATGTLPAAPYTRFSDNNGMPTPIPYSFGGLRQKYLDTISTLGLLNWSYNPIDELNSSDNRVKILNARLGGLIKYTIISGVFAELRGQYENGVTNSRSYNSTGTFSTRDMINRFMQLNTSGRPTYPVPMGGILDEGNSSQLAWNLRGQLGVDKQWGNHQINGIVGIEGREGSYEYTRGRKYGFDPNTYLFATNINYSTTYPNRPSGNYGNNNRIPNGDALSGRVNRFLSYYANAGYVFQGKYSITASARIDGSNFFGIKSNQKFLPLWSSGFGWELSKESFYHMEAFPYLKLRATYGFNGNMNNAATALPTARYSLPSGSYHTEPTLILATPPNPGLTWERTGMLNLGIDFGTKKDIITGSVEYYRKKGIDLIGNLNMESSLGFASYLANYASMKGNGVDLTLNTINIQQALIWNTNLIISYNRDEIINYVESTTPSAFLYLLDNYPTKGKPILRMFAYPSAGLDPANGNPRGYIDGKVEDFVNVLNNAQLEDLKYYGALTPRFFGSLRNSVSYKSVSISLNITGRFGYYFRRNTINYNTLTANWGGHNDYAKRWVNPGDELLTTVPSLPASLDNRYDFYQSSSDLVEKGDHLRLQDIRLSYDFNRANTFKLPFSNLQLFVYANNLGIVWRANKSGIDPDFPGLSSIPTPKSFAVGINVGF